MRTFILLAFFSAIAPAWGAPSNGAAELVRKIQATEDRIGSAPSQAARVSALRDFKGVVNDWIRKLPARNTDSEMRRLRGSLWSLDSYLKNIDTEKFIAKDCAQYRALIFLGFSPHDGAPDYVPGEARESLKMLSLVCKAPELAEIPSKESPPAAEGSN